MTTINKKMLALMEEQTALLREIHKHLTTNNQAPTTVSLQSFTLAPHLMTDLKSSGFISDNDQIDDYDDLTQTISFTSKNNQKGYFAFNKDRVNTKSNCIKTLAYKNGDLYITFKASNETYKYSANHSSVNVLILFHDLVKSPSIGQSFHKLVLKNKHLQCFKL